MPSLILRIVLLAGLAAAPAHAVCRPAEQTLRDWGLHRAWEVVADCAHPERPERLEEIRWPGELPAGIPRQKQSADFQPVEVQPGMPVRVLRRTAAVTVELHGTALARGRRGELVAVRAGFGSAVIHGVVRGPALVELRPEKRAR
jgi:hypothetical protein